ncbi:MAG: DUF1292 domain-containing protein [Bacillota bacterium]
MSLEEDTLVLTDEDGKEHEFQVVDMLEVEGKEYAILLPMDEESGEAIVFKIEMDENGDESLAEIEEDKEWELVVKTWEQLIEEEEEEDEEEDETD